MTLTIDVPPEVERALEEQAQRTGQSVADLAATLIVRAVFPVGHGGPSGQPAEIAARLAAVARIGSYDTRVQAGMPPLSDEAVSRESIYEDRGL